MEIPQPIKKQVARKGGLKGLKDLMADDETIEQRSSIYQALSDPIRLKLLDLLMVQPLCVCMIKDITRISDSKLSYHLSLLKESGLIEGEQKGNWIIYSPTKLGRKFRI